jgi:lysozyme
MANPRMTIAKLGMSAFITLAATFGAPATMVKEGVELAPYYDKIGNKVTWCAGETEVGYKEKFTFEECGLLYHMRYGYYSMRVGMMYSETAKATVTPQIHAALTDMAYNVGLSSVERSTMMKRANAGDLKGSCEAILLYKYAGGRDCSQPANKRFCGGIWTRRLEFNKMCMQGVSHE